jgi:hypothetical protein
VPVLAWKRRLAAACVTTVVACGTTGTASHSIAPSPLKSPALGFTATAAGTIVREYTQSGSAILFSDISEVRLPDGSYMVYALKHNPISVPHPLLTYVGFKSDDGINFGSSEVPLTYARDCTSLVTVVQEGSGYRMYCTEVIRPYPNRLFSMISEYSQDGIHFRLEAGSRLATSAVDPSFEVHTPSAVYDLPDGRHRMLFMVITTPPSLQPFSNVIYGATSSDWLNWTVDSQSVLNEGAYQLSQQDWPTVVRWRDRYLMFYNSYWPVGRAPALGNPLTGEHGIYIAMSTDGLSFTTLEPAGIRGSESAEIVLQDGRISLAYNTACCPQPSDELGSDQLDVALLTPNQ